jgi:DNA-binding NarL/FixJ family response regulator
MPIRVLCVDDHRLVREGIASILSIDPNLSVVGFAQSGEEAIERYMNDRPDIVLMDLQLQPSMSGIEATKRIRRHDPMAKVIVLTAFDGDEDIARSLEAGAATFLLKDTLVDDVIRVIHEVWNGTVVHPPEIGCRLATPLEYERLTSREVEVLELIASGLRNKEIAAAFNRSEETVHVHVRRILHKLGVSDRNAAIGAAIKRGIIHIR